MAQVIQVVEYPEAEIAVITDTQGSFVYSQTGKIEALPDPSADRDYLGSTYTGYSLRNEVQQLYG